jgi:hypothetical protein
VGQTGGTDEFPGASTIPLVSFHARPADGTGCVFLIQLRPDCAKRLVPPRLLVWESDLLDEFPVARFFANGIEIRIHPDLQQAGFVRFQA